MADQRQYRKTRIEAFLIPSDPHTIGDRDWASRAPRAVWYGMPEQQQYDHPAGGTYLRCRVQCFDADREPLGFLPLPDRYADAWIQLCYLVVYWMSEWQAWVRELGRPRRISRQPASFVKDCINNAGVRFIKYLTIRRLVIDELLQHSASKDGSDELLIFDEYLIRDRFDWFWVRFDDVPKMQREYLLLDPVHENNSHIFTWRNSKLLVPPQILPPPASPTHTWIWGQINHFDFQRTFDDAFADVLRFYRSKSLRPFAEDMPYRADNPGLPDKWHEGHQPAVRFLTADEDARFGHPRAPEAGTSGLADQPPMPGAAGPSASSAIHKGIVDDARTRAIVADFTQPTGGLSLAEVHERLESALGPRFDAIAWGLFFNAVDSAPGEEPLMTVEEAFEFYRAEGEADWHGQRMEEYRRRVKGLY